jgi:hypothetical protein
MVGAVSLALLASLVLLAGGGKGPQSGNGGNASNNGNGNTVWIYHSHGNGTWSMKEIPLGSISGHAAHGDLWYQTGCPLTGPADGCF